MQTLAAFRAQNPSYDDMPDAALVDALHKKFYSDMPRADFDAKVGYASTSMPDAIGRGLAQGVTFGFADELQGANAAAPPGVGMLPFGGVVQPAVGLARMGYEKLFGGDEATKAYTDARNKARALDDKANTDRPYSYGGGQIGGAVASALVPVGAATSGAGALANTARMVTAGAGMGALQGAGEAPEMADVPRGSAIGAAIGGAASAAVPAVVGAVRRGISPLHVPAEREALAQVLEREGVEMTAGQMSGNRPLRWMEGALGDVPFAGGQAARAMDRQGQQFTAAVMRRAGEDAPLATPDVLRNAAARIGADFDAISARNVATFDNQFANDISRVITDYDRVLPSQQRGIVMAYIQDLSALPGRMDGAAYQEARSRLTKQASSITRTDPLLSEALFGIRNALDGAMDRSISAADRAAWGEARSQWRNLKAIEKAATGAGERTAEGYISPSQIRNAVVAQNRTGYARGHGDLSELARAGEAILKPLPNSGTAPRQNIQNIGTALFGGALGTGVATGGIGLVPALATAAGPAALGRALLSGPVQGYLTNRVAAGPMSEETRRLAELLMALPSRQIGVSSSERRPAKR